MITELVLNHTSDQHPWFQRARRAPPGSKERNYYVWSDNQEQYKEARIIFKDFETSNWAWDPVAKAYYWHRFYSHQPDLNFDNPVVKQAIFEAVDFWLDMGVDGLRLDAVPYLFEREGTSCENLPETHQFLKELRRHVDEKYRNRMLLAEANQWPEEAVTYFGDGDECHMAFHFPVMPRIFMAVHMEDRFPIVDILNQTPEIPANCQWTLFLRNHDELTLEMVTDEDRDYMYKVYASDPKARLNLGIRRRLTPLLGGNRRKIELLNALLFSLPGTPVIYYGDEIGMGDNFYLGDRNGVRTPMQWSADRNAGFSRANPQRLYLPIIIDPEHHYEAINVEAQQQNLSSPLWWMKRLILLRKRYQAFSRGTHRVSLSREPTGSGFYPPACRMRSFSPWPICRALFSARKSIFPNSKGACPWSYSAKPNFRRSAICPTLLPWARTAFTGSSSRPRTAAPARSRKKRNCRSLEVAGPWEQILTRGAKSALEKILPGYLKNCRWFGGKARRIRSVTLADSVSVPFDSDAAYITVVEVNYRDGEPESYFLPLTFIAGERATELTPVFSAGGGRPAQNAPRRGSCRWDTLRCALRSDISQGFARCRLSRRRSFQGKSSEIAASPSKIFRKLSGSPDTIAGTDPVEERTEQYLHRVWRPVYPQDVPSPAGGRESRSGDRRFPH